MSTRLHLAESFHSQPVVLAGMPTLDGLVARRLPAVESVVTAPRQGYRLLQLLRRGGNGVRNRLVEPCHRVPHRAFGSHRSDATKPTAEVEA